MIACSPTVKQFGRESSGIWGNNYTNNTRLWDKQSAELVGRARAKVKNECLKSEWSP